jgi:hypothetical protein
MKKLYTLLLLFTIALFYSIPTQAYDIPLNYGVSDNDQAFVQTKNLFENNVAQTLNVNGATIESFGNGEFLINGTTSTGSRVSLFNEINFQTTLAGIIANANDVTVKNSTNYRISLLVVSGSVSNPVDSSIVLNQPSLNAINTIRLDNSNEVSFISATTTAYFYMFLANTSTFTDYRVRFQIEEGSTRTSYAPYGFLSLNDIFVDGQLLLNPNFDTTSTNWTLRSNTSQNVLDGVNTITATATGTSIGISQTITGITSNKIYVKIRYKPQSTNNLFVGDGGAGFSFSVVSNFWQTTSGLRITTDNDMRIYQSMTIGQTIQIDYMYAYNTNNLGIDHLSKFVLDSLYDDWFYNSIYNQGYDDGYLVGFNDGFNDGYDEGFDDGVASDTSYAVGYALGLSEGEDMETGSSLLILIVALIGFVMMIFGFTTKRGIFNLLSVGAFVVLGTLLVQFVGFVIIAIGLVLINIYYAFFGDL